MMAKRGRRGEDGTTKLSKPVPGSSERALVNKSSNAMDEIKTHSASPQVFKLFRRSSECRRLTADDVHQRSPKAK